MGLQPRGRIEDRSCTDKAWSHEAGLHLNRTHNRSRVDLDGLFMTAHSHPARAILATQHPRTAFKTARLLEHRYTIW